ncbi:hypothetical protein ACG7TL_003068 [Trametes sanguinea]
MASEQSSRPSSLPPSDSQAVVQPRAVNPSTALARLNAAVEAIDDLKDESVKLRRDMGVILKALHLENNTLRAENTALGQRVSILEMALGLNDEEGGNTEGGEENVEDMIVEGDAATVAERAKVEKSITAVNSKPIKTAVNLVFKHLMGVQSLVPEKLPPHPTFPTGEAPESVPIDSATGKPFLRFRWDKDAKFAVNATALQDVISGIQTLGPTLCPAAGLFLPVVLPAHLKDRVLKKFKYLHNEWCREHEVAEDEDEVVPPRGGNGGGDDLFAEDGMEEEGDRDGVMAADETSGRRKAVKTRNRRATQNSRVAAKLAIRLRKRKAHPLYNDPKYDSAFIANAMSEEEDDPTVQAGEGKRYISRAPDYRSEVAKQLYAEIDAIPDPNPDKSGRGMVPRVRGEELRDSVPPRAKTVKNRVREWQIKPERLQQNPGWLTSGRVSTNGRLWGDAEDPVDEEPRKRKEGPEIVQKRSELDAVLGGKKVADLIGQFSGDLDFA